MVHEPRPGKDGRLERATSVRNRDAVNNAMICLMGNAKLRVSEAAAMTWKDLRHMRGGSSPVRVCGKNGT